MEMVIQSPKIKGRKLSWGSVFGGKDEEDQELRLYSCKDMEFEWTVKVNEFEEIMSAAWEIERIMMCGIIRECLKGESGELT